MTDHNHHDDVVIIGGGVAGLSAAVALARSLRSVVVVDAGEPRNAPASGAHNVLGQEGIAPFDLLANGRREATAYGAQIREGYATTARRVDDRFEIGLADGTTLQARRLLLASGLADELPDIPGVAEQWGKSVLHCPYCHGWEVRGQGIGVLGTSPMNVHQALLFRQLSDDVTLFAHTMPELDDETTERLAARGIQLVDGTVERLRVDDEGVRAAVVGGREFAIDAAVVAPRFIARTDLYEQLGGTPTEHPMGRLIETDPRGQTAVPGVWAAGNASELHAMVAASNGAGVQAAAALNADLVDEDAELAVRERAAVVA